MFMIDAHDKISKGVQVDPKVVSHLENVLEQPKILDGITKGSSITLLKCDWCDESFSRNCHLEVHMETHDVVKEHKCDDCGKLSFLKWRLKKHIEVHSEKEKPCYFWREGKTYVW